MDLLYVALSFILYVFAFWLFWKIFDLVVFYFKEKPECKNCEALKSELEKLKTRQDCQISESAILTFLNKSDIEQLEEAPGIGSRRSKTIVNKRPLKTIEAANETLGSKTVAAITHYLRFKEDYQRFRKNQ